MIEKHTLFVLGAGASCPYGFPSGSRLRSNIISRLSLEPSQPGNLIKKHRHTLPAGWTQSRSEEMASLLVKAGPSTTIDDFLSQYSDDQELTKVGKICIALEIIECEKEGAVLEKAESSGSGKNQNWLDYLLYYMKAGAGGLEDFLYNNNVSFITFNYDRSLEFLLSSRLSSYFRLDNSQTLEAIGRINIMHVYGSLGQYAFLEDKLDKSTRSFIDTVDDKGLVNAASNIRTISEERRNEKLIDDIERQIARSEIRCFLGFGYDVTNLRELGFDEMKSAVKWRGTSLGLERVERARIARLFSNVNFELCDIGYDCRQYLQHNDILDFVA